MPSRAISAHTTAAPGSTSDLIGNVGANTRRFNAQQLLGAIFTSQGQLLYSPSSFNSTFLNPPSSNAMLSYSSGSSAPAWIIGSSGQFWYVSSAGVSTVLAAPSSGAVLVYSTANTSVGPRWEIPTSGALFAASSLGVPTWIALGTSGQILQSTGGSPAWVASTAVLRETLTGSGDMLITSSAGDVTRLGLGTSGQVLQSTGSRPTWVAPTAGGSTSGWKLTHNTTQAIAASGSVLNWNVETFDSDAFHSTVTNSSLVTITSPGTYLMGVQASFNTSALAIEIIIRNGTTELAYHSFTASGGGNHRVNASMLQNFATSGDTLNVIALGVGSTNEIASNVYSPIFWGQKVS